MANLDSIIQLRPSFADYQLRNTVFHRGDTLFFCRNHRSPHYSTDAQGFRHTVLGGETLGVDEIVERERYGLVLGGSRAFGYGLERNEHAIPSLLSEHFGFPFANISLPQASSRNLSSLLFANLLRAPSRPSAVVLISSGDFSNFCYSAMSDSIFGSPNPKLLPLVFAEQGGVPASADSVQAMLNFTSLWTRAIASMCRTHQVPLIQYHDTTFFEKTVPDQHDIDCALGTPSNPAEARWFINHKAFATHYYDRRETLARKLGLPLVGAGRAHDLGFIDEIHYDEAGAEAVANDIASTLQTLL